MNTLDPAVLMPLIIKRLQETLPDIDDDPLDLIADLLCYQVLIKQSISDPYLIAEDEWYNLIESASSEIDGDSFDLIPVSENQFACEGYDLVYMLNFDEGCDTDLYDTLGLTYTLTQAPMDPDEPFYTFDQIDEDGIYLITWPTGETQFATCDACEIAPFDPERYQALKEAAQADEDEGEDDCDPCDGNCDACEQDCVGKLPYSI